MKEYSLRVICRTCGLTLDYDLRRDGVYVGPCEGCLQNPVVPGPQTDGDLMDAQWEVPVTEKFNIDVKTRIVDQLNKR